MKFFLIFFILLMTVACEQQERPDDDYVLIEFAAYLEDDLNKLEKPHHEAE